MTKLNTEISQLTPAERLNLSLAALARGDMAELTALQDGCPRSTYYWPNTDYFLPFQAAIFMTMTWSETCVLLHAKIELSSVCVASFEMAATHPEHKHKVNSAEIEALQESKEEHLMLLKANYEGFRQACIELGLDFADLLMFSKLEDKCLGIDMCLMQGEPVPLHEIEQAKGSFMKIFNNYCDTKSQILH